MFSRFFIDRPIFASVMSIVITIAGLVAMLTLPIAQYPEIAPPTVQVACTYPGASAKVVADTVAAPIEQQVNGVENMLYMSSQCTNDGAYNLTITFRLGTVLDMAQVLVQNRVSLAMPVLPDIVKQTGVTTKKQSPNIMLVVNLISPDRRYDQLYLSNFATISVKDELARLEGVGDVAFMGQRDYSMRIWLDPDKLAGRNLTVNEVVAALREQNVQVAAGQIGQPPVPRGLDFQYTMTTLGRLTDPDQFANIVIKTGSQGEVTRLRDVSRVERAPKSQDQVCTLDGEPTVGLAVYQLPGSNAVATAGRVKAKMEELKKRRFREGLDYKIVYDTTPFVIESIHEVRKALFEAIALVALVVLLFLQNWRATVIPLIAVPVSLVGTFAVMACLGFSLNNISLCGLVLAIGIVVDDAIVVVENVERWIEHGLAPREAAYKSMEEVTVAVIAIAFGLSAVFVPTAFLSGITGQFYRQFALTIATATLISAFNSLTLSPALAAILLRPRGAKRDPLTWILDTLLGWFFRGFNGVFNVTTSVYARLVRVCVRATAIALLVYLGLLGLTYVGFTKVPTGFVPQQDKGYLIVNAQLPDSASQERTLAVTRKMEEIARSIPGVGHTVTIAGQSFLLNANGSNFASMFAVLEPFEERRHEPEKGADAVAVETPPPPLRRSRGRPDRRLRRPAGGRPGQRRRLQVDGRGPGRQRPPRTPKAGGKSRAERERPAGPGRPVRHVPRLDPAALRRHRPHQVQDNGRGPERRLQHPPGHPGQLLRQRLQRVRPHLAGQRPGRQPLPPPPGGRQAAEGPQRAGRDGAVGALCTVRDSTGPVLLSRYNTHTAAAINGGWSPQISSGQAIDRMQKLADAELPGSMSYEWTELTFQQLLAGNTALFIFPLCVLAVFLVHSAEYESWALPLAIILIVPMSLLCALAGVWLRGNGQQPVHADRLRGAGRAGL